MKLKADINVVDFLRTVNTCQNDVWFITDDGDRINLKSELSKYLFLATSLSSRKQFYDLGEIHCQTSEDYAALSSYLHE